MSAAAITTTTADVLVLPGRGNSPAAHWQTHWEAADPGLARVLQREWLTPRRDEWVRTLAEVLAARSTPAVLVAHSLAVSLVIHLVAAWPSLYPGKALPVRGALLVAPSDVEAADYPPGPVGFDPLPLAPLPFPSIVVASTDDPRVTLERARFFATAWGARLEIAGALGHMGSDSNLGDWPQAKRWLEEVRLPL
uniref:RBBP9/YdeN family alpha/beta hydrolase n=1 Tax=Hydrogenophaga palleronii TaxID=65655 RepID=UPI000826F6F4